MLNWSFSKEGGDDDPARWKFAPGSSTSCGATWSAPARRIEDLARERLSENPSRWYLTGFIAPKEDEVEADDPAVQEEDEREAEQDLGSGAGGAAGDDEPSEAPVTHRRFLPSSIGLTVLVPMDVETIEARVSWGDYVTEPPLPEGALLSTEDDDGSSGRRVDWVRVPQQRSVTLDGTQRPRVGRQWVPDSGPTQMAGGGALELTSHAREFAYRLPDGAEERVRAVTVFLVNRRRAVTRRYADVAYAFQARLELVCPDGFRPRFDLSGYGAVDEDLQIADLHYRDVEEYAVGRNAAASWGVDSDGGKCGASWTDHLPLAEVERVAPNENIPDVEFGMEVLATLAAQSGDALAASLARLPVLYSAGSRSSKAQSVRSPVVGARRRERIIAGMRRGRGSDPSGNRHPRAQCSRPARLPHHERGRCARGAAPRRDRNSSERPQRRPDRSERRRGRRDGALSSSPSSC